MAGLGEARCARGLVILSGAAFLLTVLYFACTIPADAPPDEALHVSLARLFHREAGLTIAPDTAGPFLVQESMNFFFYHLVVGKLLHVQRWLAVDERLFLRGLNVLLAAWFVIACYILIQVTLDDCIERTLAFVMLTNLLMVSYLFAAVNSDNLMNVLLVSACVAYAVAVRFESLPSFFVCISCALFAALTKRTVCPLALLLIALLFYSRREICSTAYLSRAWSRDRGLKLYGAFAMCLVATVTCCLVFGGNLYRYGTPTPNPVDVFGEQRCRAENPIYAKDMLLDEEARLHPGGITYDPLTYLFVWIERTIDTTIGIFAYQSFFQSRVVLTLFELALGAVAIMLLINWQQLTSIHRAFVVCIVGHCAILVFGVFHPWQNRLGMLPRYAFFADQGRYVFPVLAPCAIVAARVLLAPVERRDRILVALLFGVLFVCAAMPTFLLTPPSQRLVSNGELQSRHIRNLIRSQRFISRDRYFLLHRRGGSLNDVAR